MRVFLLTAIILISTPASYVAAGTVKETCRGIWKDNNAGYQRCVDRWKKRFGEDSLGSGGLDSKTLDALRRSTEPRTASDTGSPVLESVSEFLISVTWLAATSPLGYLFAFIGIALALLTLFMPVYICLIFHQSRKMRGELERLNATLAAALKKPAAAPPQKQKPQG